MTTILFPHEPSEFHTFYSKPYNKPTKQDTKTKPSKPLLLVEPQCRTNNTGAIIVPGIRPSGQSARAGSVPCARDWIQSAGIGSSGSRRCWGRKIKEQPCGQSTTSISVTMTLGNAKVFSM